MNNSITLHVGCGKHDHKLTATRSPGSSLTCALAFLDIGRYPASSY